MTVNTLKRRIGAAAADPVLKEKEEQLSAVLGTKVQIKKSGGGGKIVIDFYSPEELEQITTKLS